MAQVKVAGVVMAFPSTLMKPDPDGLEVMVMDEVRTMKVAEAALELASVIVTVLAPPVEAGTVKVAPVNEPVLPVLVVPPRLTATPLKVAVIALALPKPVPDTVTVEPTLPLVGLRVIAGTTVNEAEPV